jgi:hypothetical protein
VKNQKQKESGEINVEIEWDYKGREEEKGDEKEERGEERGEER